MGYRVRFTTQTGATFYWERTFATRTGATHSAQLQADSTGYTFAVEEVPEAPEPTSTTERLVSLFRDLHGGQQTVPNEADGVEYVPGVKPEPTSTTDRLVGLIRDRHAKGLAKYGTTLDRADLSPEQWAQHAIEEALDLAGYLMRLKDGLAPEPGSTAARHVEILRGRIAELEAVQKAMSRDLAFALQIGDAMRQAMRTGEWRPGQDAGMARNAMAGWDRFRPGLAKAPSASEAPGEGGDSDRRRLEALERWLKVDTYRLVYFASRGAMVALSDSMIEDVFVEAPTLAALADKLAEKEGKA